MKINVHSYEFDSRIQRYDLTDPKSWTEEEIKNEPMVFSADYSHANTLGGSITRWLLEQLPEPFVMQKMIVDTRVHMLMPKFFPCIPGWHHDDVPREREDGQPNYINPSYKAEHIMFLVNGSIAPTEFAIGKTTFAEVDSGSKYYKSWDWVVKRAIEKGELQLLQYSGDHFVGFNYETWHRGTAAIRAGWRYFFRASIYSGRPVLNQSRKQVQAYLVEEAEGW